MNKKDEKKGSEELEEIKVILIGDSGIGKTNLINTSVGMQFSDKLKPTISPSYNVKIFEIEGKKYRLNLWDTAGQEKYVKVTKLFFKGSGIIILVYDITNKESFKSLENWHQMSEDIIESEHIYGLVGNKNDLYLDSKVSAKEVQDFAQSIKTKYKIVSAKEQPELFVEFLEELVKDYHKINIKNRRKSVKLNKDKSIKKSKCMGCN